MSCCAVIRHAEREDATRLRWAEAPQGYIVPPHVNDPELSTDGKHLVAGLANRVLTALGDEAQVQVVVTSPYMRCVQTAVGICRHIGPNATLLIDNMLGEVYGPDIFGDEEPAHLLRGPESIARYCHENGVNIGGRTLGQWPKWPESLRSARLRFINRFLQYLHRGSATKKNFVLVTHADGVAAALSTLPAMADRLIEAIEYGGFFVAKQSSTPSRFSFRSILPTSPKCDRSTMTTSSPKLSISKGGFDKNDPFGVGDRSEQPPLAVAQTWNVDIFKIKVSQHCDQTVDIKKTFMGKVRSWSKMSRYDEEKIFALLNLPNGVLSFAPNGTTEAVGRALGEDSDPVLRKTSVSSFGSSTVIFGGSTHGHSPYKQYLESIESVAPTPEHTPDKAYAVINKLKLPTGHYPTTASEVVTLSCLGRQDSAGASTSSPTSNSCRSPVSGCSASPGGGSSFVLDALVRKDSYNLRERRKGSKQFAKLTIAL